ncbi:MAG: hypothetical protein AB7P14_28350 [Blastocatellales bacterium]
MRDQLYALADIATTEFIQQRHKSCFEISFQEWPPLIDANEDLSITDEAEDFEKFLKPLSIDERLEAEERAAVMEYDGGLMRNQAEKVVMIEYWRKRKQGDANNGSNHLETN